MTAQLDLRHRHRRVSVGHSDRRGMAMSNDDTGQQPEAEVDQEKKAAEERVAGPAEDADPGNDTVISTTGG